MERPLLLRLVEFFVIFLLFRVVWNLYLFYVTVLKYSSLAFQGAAHVFSPLCCVRQKFSVSASSPQSAEDPPESSLRNTSQTLKEEITYIKNMVELLVTIILLFVRLQSVLITKLRYCSTYSRQQKDGLVYKIMHFFLALRNLLLSGNNSDVYMYLYLH